MGKYFKNTAQRPSWAKFFNDWKNPRNWFCGGHHNSIKEEEKPIERAKPIPRKVEVRRTVTKIIK